jgi:TonB-linked SusC/RagA family outer membrane protein
MLGFLFICTELLAQRSIAGKVHDDNGQPVIGASVIVKGTRTGTVTDSKGNFAFNIPANAKALVISAVGFTEQELPIGSESTISINLKQDARSMEQIVVTGYSREKKTQFTGAATTLSPKVVETVPVGSFDQALQGRVPGLLVNSGSGQPGSGAAVRIRGTSSLGGQAQPLYVVDGVPLASTELANINPDDFESITVLKDAGASALYGARGGLGVIVITTKRGRAGQTNFSFRTQVGFTQRPQPSQFNQMNSREMLDYEEFVGQFNTGLTAPGWVYSKKNPTYATLPATSPANNPLAASQARYDFLRDSLANNNVDYYDLLFKTGITKTNEFSMSGGTPATRYFMSFGNFNQEGTDMKSKFDRYSLRFNLDNTVGKLLTQLSSTISYSKTDWNEGSLYAGNGTANPFAMVWRAKPYENPYDAQGNLIFGTSTAAVPKAIGNLIERSDNSNWIEKVLKANTGLTFAYKIIPQLTLKNTTGLDGSNNRFQGSINAASYVGSLQTPGNSGYVHEATFNRLQIINTLGAIYNNRINRNDLEVGAYFEALRQWNEGFSLTLYNLDPRLTQTGQGSGSLPVPTGSTTYSQSGSSAKSSYGIRSLFGTARYTYNDKYTISGNIRRDGTSRIINEENRQITTWAAGLSWNAIRESFMQDQSILTDLRVRASYGKVPNIGSIPGGGSYGLGGLGWYAVPRYHGAQLPAFSVGSSAGSTISPITPSVANPDLYIETVDKTNIGADLGLWQNRIRITADVYKNITQGLFANQRLPATSGFYGSSLSINAGTMENKGLELDVNVDVIRSKNFDLNLHANHSINKNKITDLGTVTEYVNGTSIVKVGLPVGAHYSYHYLGADPATGRPIYKRLDGTPTTNISEAGQFAEFGSHLPVHVGGFSATIRYYRITLDAFFSYQFDVRRYNNVQNWVSQGEATYTGAVSQSRVLLTDQWQKPGDVKMLQSPAYYRDFTSVDISNAKFLRFRNLNIAYNIPELKIGKTKLAKSARFYIQGQNLAIWSPWSGLDPEDDNNISLAEFPNPKAVVVGLDINF